MAIELNENLRQNKYDYLCLSTDAKPVPPSVKVSTGSTLYILDTKEAFLYSEKNNNPVTSNGWWGL